MSGNGMYDMKQKLLELQTELMKNAAAKEYAPTANQPAEAQAKTSAAAPANDALSLLKEIYMNQQKMLALLNEINSKLK